MVVEGINALPVATALAEKYEVDMLIITAVDEIINRVNIPRKIEHLHRAS